VPLGEGQEHPLLRHAGEGRLAQVRSVGRRGAGLARPLDPLDLVLDRDRAGHVVDERPLSVLSGPPPCPTALIVIVAIPCWASLAAIRIGVFPPSLFPPEPWPPITTGQPPTGACPEGRKRLK